MRQARGFTLVEILVSMTIALVAVGAALTILSAQNAAFGRQSGLGTANSQAQVAMDALERAVRLAGTGLDPQMGFDFDFYKCAMPGSAVTMTESAGCSIAARDARDRADDIVVSYRDPGYSVANPTADARGGCSAANAGTYLGKVWGVVSATATTVQLVLKPGDTIFKGQVLQIACQDGLTYTYATVKTKKQSVSGGSCSNVTLTLFPDIARDLFNQPALLSTSCFSAGTARAFAVRRNRFFLHRVTGIPNPGVYLMLDQGLDLNDDGEIDDLDLQPIASDIQDIQFAYGTEQPGIRTLTTAPVGWSAPTYMTDSNTNGVWGDDPAATTGEQLTALVYAGAPTTLSNGIRVADATTQFGAANTALFAGVGQKCSSSTANPNLQYPCVLGSNPVENSTANNIFAYRWPAWTGNISEVLIGVVGRAPVADSQDVATDQTRLEPLLNRPLQKAGSYAAWYSATLPAGRKTATLLTGVRPVNLAVNRMFWN